MKSIVLKLIKQKYLTAEKIDQIKRRISGKFHLPPPSTAELLKSYRRLLVSKKIRPNKKLEKFLQKRPVRTLSGVAIVTVLTKPWPCPGRCIYCPQQAGMPKSYLKNEPAAQRAYLTRFDPYRQVATRLQMLYNNGHPTDKIELIVKGGSWQAYPWKYRVWFVKECFRGCNDFNTSLRGAERRSNPVDYAPTGLLRSPVSSAGSLAMTQKKNETAHHRIIGLTLETRPDLITPKSITQMRLLGCTRVELGVQHTDDKILKKIKRGHTLSDVKKAVAFLRAAGFKIDFHLMPQLPGSSPQKDYEMFRKVFSDPDLRPDMLKIYPCTVVAGSELYHWHRHGKFRPYSTPKLIELLIKVKSKLIPYYCRISRLIRDIPSTEIVAGNRVTNLREVIQAEMKKRGLKCKCLRCREVGHNQNFKFQISNFKLFTEKYNTDGGGVEYFLSYEDSKRQVVFAFCRLRVPLLGKEGSGVVEKKQINPLFLPLSKGEKLHQLLPELRDCAFIRELHTYGQLVSIGKNEKNASQHKGLGKKLMQEAEKIAQKHGFDKLAVIAGVGVREYYRKLGYRKEKTYMAKVL